MTIMDLISSLYYCSRYPIVLFYSFEKKLFILEASNINSFLYIYIYIYDRPTIGIMVRVFTKWSKRPKFKLRSSHTKDSNNGT